MKNKQDTKKDKDSLRTRNWTFVLYPDSVPVNWRNIINDLHVEWIESPLHDADINADATEKKSHWHILVMFDGNKSFDQVKEITDKLNAPIPQKCSSPKGLVRYMIHLDSPEKVQYSRSDIIGYGGADVAYYLQPTSSNRYELIKEMMVHIKLNRITEFTELFDYAMEERFEDWFPLLCDNSSYVVGEYIKSNRHGRSDNVRVVKVTDDGEVI